MSVPLPDSERTRPGRPRSESCGRAIEAAAVELLIEEGFGRMSMEGIAARAGVGKATLYRRWATKEELVVDAVSAQCLEPWERPDTGSVREDMRLLLQAILGRFRRNGQLLQAFAGERGRHPDLAEVFRETFQADRRAISRDVVRRGVERGELPASTDIELLAEMGPALLWHRLTVSGAPLDADLPDRIVDQLLGAT